MAHYFITTQCMKQATSKILGTVIILVSASLLVMGIKLPQHPSLEYWMIAGSCLLTLSVFWLLTRMLGQNAYDLVKNSSKRRETSIFPRKNPVGTASLLHWSLHERQAA